MRVFRAVGLSLVVLVLVSLTATLPAGAERRSETFHNMVVAVASASGGTCTGDSPPPVTTECRGWYLVLFKEEQPRYLRDAQWGLALGMDAGIVHPDGTDEPVFSIDGVTFDFDHTFDLKHLTYATVHAAVPMSDGSTRVVDLAWDGSSEPLQVAGNNGPYNTSRDIAPHYADRCFTLNLHAHQTYRGPVALSGRIDGTDVATIPYWDSVDPMIGTGNFTFTQVEHGGPGC